VYILAFVIARNDTDPGLRKQKFGTRNSGASRNLQKSDFRGKTNPTISKTFCGFKNLCNKSTSRVKTQGDF